MSLSDTALVTLIQAKNYIRMDHAASLHIAAEYVGTGDDVEDEFTLDNTPLEGTLKLYVNNVLQTETTHYSISGATITFVTPPTDTYPITASYDYAATADTFEDFDDELLESMIEAATKAVERYTARVYVNQTITEIHIGDGSNMIRLYKWPVTDVTSITVGETSLDSWTERLAMGRVYYDYGFEKDIQVEIVYEAGYGADRATVQPIVPEAVMAVLVAVANWWENRLGLSAENVSGVGSVSYEMGELPEDAKNRVKSMRALIC